MSQLSKTVIHNRVVKLADVHYQAAQQKSDSERRRALSKGFALLSVMQLLELDEDVAVDAVVDGKNDMGIDAIWVGEPQSEYFDVHLFQVKYTEDLEKDKGFPENEVIKIIGTLKTLLKRTTFKITEALDVQLSQVKAHVEEFNIPNFYIYLCNNGQGLSQNAQEQIDLFLSESPENSKRYNFRYVNHSDIFQASEKAQPINCALEFTGGFVDEAINFKRAFVGKVQVAQIAELLNQFGDRLLGRNVRDFLGFRRAVNEGIRSTLSDPSKSKDFYFLNNGITFVCEKLDYAQGASGARARLTNAQIINGGQTSRTIQSIVNDRPNLDFSQAFVLVRAYQVDMNDEGDLIHDIITATNSQNAIFARDLHANDPVQRKLEAGLKHYGIRYLRRRNMQRAKPDDIRMELAAECLITVLLKKPVDAKYRKALHFTKEYYAEAFDENRVTSEFVWFVTRLFKRIESARKSPASGMLIKYPFIPLSSHYLLLLIHHQMVGSTVIDAGNIRQFLSEVDGAGFLKAYEAALQVMAIEIDKTLEPTRQGDAFLMAQVLRGDNLNSALLQHITRISKSLCSAAP
ncbi:MAG: AIPR family protein [Methylococcus sp.]